FGLPGGLGGEALFAHLALLGGGEFGRVLALDDVDRTAGLLDRFAGALRDAGDLEAELSLELALAEQANAVLAAAGQASALQRRMVERGLDVELAGVDRLLHGADVHFGIIAREDVVEAALRQPHVERHLAAFEAGDADARARLGTLLAAAGGLAETRADASADADTRLTRAFVVFDFVQFHVVHSLSLLSRMPREGRLEKIQAVSSTFSRWWTFLIWPRTSGVSSSSTVRPILLRPRPTSVARCVLSRRIGEPVWVILILAMMLTPPPLRPGPRLRRRWRHRGPRDRRPSCHGAAKPSAGWS